MKRVFKILGTLAGGAVFLVALAIGAIFYLTSDMVRVGDKFFDAAASQDMEQAYEYLSEDFRAATSKDDLLAYLRKNSMTSFKETNWESRSINGGRGELVGSITTEPGGVVPVTLNFVKGENGWRIYSIQKPSAGVHEDSSAKNAPSIAERKRIVAKSTGVFAHSVAEGRMSKFHSHISKLWQRQITPAELRGQFRPFFEADLDLTVLDNYSPIIDRSFVDENGTLVIEGHYETRPSQAHFKQQYIYEGIAWKLVGFRLELR